ncbi:Protein of unknown function [Cotesia congregata]|uniref:EGF-like domain-containing protein n=1 Tax=Cotesia congregata TaxID=51543 RepID=A0A8J2EBL0_COTCN|nr:Protein of unknown function [Cotesia congregata]
MFDSDCKSQNHIICSEDNECVCKKNYIKIGLSCRPLIGSFCKKNEDCFPENSVCVDHKCKCKEYFVPKSYERCEPTYFHSKCNSRDELCQEAQFFSCTNDGKCFCPPNHIVSNDKCLPLLNEHCVENEECLIDFSSCVNNQCQCRPEYAAQDNNLCLPTRLNYKCKFDEDCSKIHNSKCSEFKGCICRKNYYQLTETICSPSIGGPCASNMDCTVENSFCIKNSCKFLYKSCHLDEDCVNIKFSKCSSNNECICEPNYLASTDKTSCLPLIGGECELDEDCVTENSNCYSRKCQCKKYFVPNVIDGKNECERRLPCSNHIDCALTQNFLCSDDKVCACRKNHHEFNNKTFCTPIINEECSTDKDCRFDNFHCFNFTCQCKPNYFAVSDTQCEIEQSVVHCSDNIDCGDPWHAECSINNYCVCKSNNRLINKATCYPLLGGPCWKDDQCSLPNSVCIDYRCKCQSGFKAVATNLCIPAQ